MNKPNCKINKTPALLIHRSTLFMIIVACFQMACNQSSINNRFTKNQNVGLDHRVMSDVGTSALVNDSQPASQERSYIADKRTFIVSKNEVDKFLAFVPEGSYFTPTLSQVGQMRSHLKSYFEHNTSSQSVEISRRFDQYIGQYIGVNVNGGQRIYGNFFCAGPIDQFYLVKDGGSCYFRAYFDLKRQKTLSLNVNGSS